MIARMREIADAEGIVIDDAALGAIAYRADGGLRDALTMLEQVAAFASGPVDAATVDAAFGQTGRAFARALRDVSLDGGAAEALRIIDEASDAGADMSGLIRSTIAEFRHLLVARVNPELLARDLAEDDARIAAERAAGTPQVRLVRALRLLTDALGAARGSGNARLELESAVLRFVLTPEDPALDALSARLTALEAGLRPSTELTRSVTADVRRSVTAAAAAPEPPPQQRQAPAPPPVVADAPAAAPPAELSLQKLRTLWQNIRTRAEGDKTSLRAALSRAHVAALDGTTLTLRVPDPVNADILKRETATVKKAIADVTGRVLDVRVALGAAAMPPESSAGGGGAGVTNGEGEPGDDLMRYALEKLT